MALCILVWHESIVSFETHVNVGTAACICAVKSNKREMSRQLGAHLQVDLKGESIGLNILMSTSRRCRLPGQTFQPTQSIWGSALEIVLGCCQMLHNTSCNRCNRSRGLLCVWMKKMNVAPSPDHLTQAVKLTAMCKARQSCYVLQLCLARSMPSHAIRMTLQ